jgi:hypothetical protein
VIIARNAEFLVEFEDGLFSIARYADGKAKAHGGPGHVKEAHELRREFIAAVASHGPDRAIRSLVYGRMYRLKWLPMYKPAVMAGRPI